MDPQIENQCWEVIGRVEKDFPYFCYKKYNPETKYFSVGMKAESEAQKEKILQFCKKIQDPRFRGYSVWKWNKRYIDVKWTVDIQMPEPEPKPKPKKKNRNRKYRNIK